MFRSSVARVFRSALTRSSVANQYSANIVSTIQPDRWYTSPPNKNEPVVTPWYIAEALKTTQPEISESSKFPILPDRSPPSLAKIVEFAIKDMGLKDVTVVDKRTDSGAEVSSALGPALLVVGTGTSEKHLGSAGGLLMTWLKREFRIYADREGVLTTNFLKLHNRRQKRRQQRHRFAKENSQLQRVGSWISVDTKLENIYVHIMTPERRTEVDLDNLHDGFEESALSEEDLQKLNDQYADPSTIDSGEHLPHNSSSLGPKTSTRSYSTTRKPGDFTEKSREEPLNPSLDPFPSSREELALENLASENRADLTETSPEVLNFVKHFPAVPTVNDWKHRLRFFALATVQSPLFPPSRLVSEAELQQASGFVLDDEDIEIVVSAICYHSQSQFAALSRDDESVMAFTELCNEKAQLLVSLYDFAMRPLKRPFLTNPRLLTLMYRTFTSPSATSATPAQSLDQPLKSKDAINQTPEVFTDLSRAVPLRYLLETTEEMSNLSTVGMLLSSLCTKDSFDAFWKVSNATILSTSNRELAEHIIDLTVSLVVRSGVHQQITYAIQTFLPNAIVTKKIRLTPIMVESINRGLELVDNGRNGSFASVRKIVARYQALNGPTKH